MFLLLGLVILMPFSYSIIAAVVLNSLVQYFPVSKMKSKLIYPKVLVYERVQLINVAILFKACYCNFKRRNTCFLKVKISMRPDDAQLKRIYSLNKLKYITTVLLVHSLTRILLCFSYHYNPNLVHPLSLIHYDEKLHQLPNQSEWHGSFPRASFQRQCHSCA